MSATTLSEVFRDAQKYLWDGIVHDGNCEFICHAINFVDADPSLLIVAKKVVTDAIHPSYTFDNWLILQDVHYLDMYDCARVQAHRLQWLKMLEAQFKEA